MQKLPNFNFSSITTVPQALKKIESQVRQLAQIIDNTKEFSEDDKVQLVENIDWLKRYYERAEKVITEHD
jgi:uncharacterized protein YoxC